MKSPRKAKTPGGPGAEAAQIQDIDASDDSINGTSCQTPCADRIADYHALGWNCIPLLKGTRDPAVTWKAYQTERITDDLVAEWQTHRKGCNLAVVTGKISGIFVVDIDSPEGQAEVDRRGMPQTPTVKTSKGRHYYFRHPGHRVKNATRILDGIDIKGDAGCATLPPSLHHETGQAFTWEVSPFDTSVADAPQWLLELIAPPPPPPPPAPYAPLPTNGRDPYADKAVENVLQELATAPEGTRNDALNRASMRLGQFVEPGRLVRAEAEHQLRTIALSIGLDKGEIDRTIQSGLNAGLAEPEYEGLKPDPVVRKPPEPEPPPTGQATDVDLPEPEPEPGPETEPITSKAVSAPKVVSADYIAALADLGYTFRLNDCDDSIEVNGEYLSDPLRATIRSQTRDIGFKGMAAMEDSYLANAYANKYHPIRDYLDNLTWDGKPHIATLASFFTDTHDVFYPWLRRWLIGAVAKTYTGSQNPMLVLAGAQDIGKSFLSAWIASPKPDYFYEGRINADDKDSYIRLMSNWVWEVSELGSTTRWQDREALKAIITMQTVKVRKPYGHADTRKPALASFIGTINDEGGGFLSDPTGSRRFHVCKLTSIDWGYSDQIDVNQLWAEAMAAYHAGETTRLTPEESALSRSVNTEYEVEDPVEGILLRYFVVIPGDKSIWLQSTEIVDVLEANGLRGTSRKGNLMALGVTMQRLGCEKKRRRLAQNQNPVSGFCGIKERNLV